jgi:hypothetical protein
MCKDELLEFVRRASPVDADIPSRCELAIDRACESDRRFFERHPDKDVRFRFAFHGEFGHLVALSETSLVRVNRVDPHTRVRSCGRLAVVDIDR